MSPSAVASGVTPRAFRAGLWPIPSWMELVEHLKERHEARGMRTAAVNGSDSPDVGLRTETPKR